MPLAHRASELLPTHPLPAPRNGCTCRETQYLGEQYRNPFYGILTLPIWVNFKVFGQFWWFQWSGRAFLRQNGIENVSKFGLEVDFWTFLGPQICAKTFVAYKLRFLNELFKTAPTTLGWSGLRSPSKASKLDLIFQKKHWEIFWGRTTYNSLYWGNFSV